MARVEQREGHQKSLSPAATVSLFEPRQALRALPVPSIGPQAEMSYLGSLSQSLSGHNSGPQSAEHFYMLRIIL